MKCIFFNYNDSLANTSRDIFKSLGLNNIIEGESTYSINETYFKKSILGIELKLEENCYEHEEEFRFTLFVDQDALSRVKPLNSQETELLLTYLISQNISEFLGIKAFIEVDDHYFMFDSNENILSFLERV